MLGRIVATFDRLVWPWALTALVLAAVPFIILNL